MKRAWGMGVVVCVMAAALLLAPVQTALVAQATEPVDYDAVTRIKDEGLNRSQIMDTMSWLTDVHGPRLTGSPNYKKAGEWAMEKLKSWGLVNVRPEPWRAIPRTGQQGDAGTSFVDFGRGWSNEKFHMQVTAPVPFHVIGFAKAWSAGTNGVVTGEAALALMEREEDFAKYKGQLKGKFVITSLQAPLAESSKALSTRYDEKGLAELATEQVTVGPARSPRGDFAGRERFSNAQQRFLAAEGVAGWIETSRIADGGTVFASSGGSRTAGASDPPNLVRVAITLEHYGRIVRLLQKKIPVTIEANIQNTFHEKPELNNFFGEIAGTDKADEVVMVGAHFDSWHGGTGATDNAAGSAVMMEVMRILKASGVKLRRTVRIGLWGGEEQGLMGSRYYVRHNFAEPSGTTWTIKPAHAKFAGYFNVDNGTGKIRGVYLQGNEAVAPIFRAWMEPFHNLGMNTLTPRDTGGTDHLSFDGVGLPGFQFIQDDVEYDTRTHHSNMDTYERIQEADMKQMAVIVASFVYHTANRSQVLPRKPMPAVPAPRGQN